MSKEKKGNNENRHDYCFGCISFVYAFKFFKIPRQPAMLFVWLYPHPKLKLNNARTTQTHVNKQFFICFDSKFKLKKYIKNTNKMSINVNVYRIKN